MVSTDIPLLVGTYIETTRPLLKSQLSRRQPLFLRGSGMLPSRYPRPLLNTLRYTLSLDVLATRARGFQITALFDERVI